MPLHRRAFLALPLAGAWVPAWTAAQGTLEPIRIALIEGLSGAFANAGEAVYRNLLWAVERVSWTALVRRA